MSTVRPAISTGYHPSVEIREGIRKWAPALVVFAKFEDGKKEERVTFGKTDSDAYASRPGEPGAAKVDATDLTEAMKSLDELSK